MGRYLHNVGREGGRFSEKSGEVDSSLDSSKQNVEQG